jgi:hypothetical protein
MRRPSYVSFLRQISSIASQNNDYTTDPGISILADTRRLLKGADFWS